MSYTIIPGGAFREGDFLLYDTPAASKLPAPQGSMAALPGPTAAQVVLGTTTAAGAPAQTYYIVVSYTASSNESLLSQEFIVQCPVGYVPTVEVLAAGEPADATNFAAYASTAEGSETLQQASKTTTATGTAFTLPYPLINLSGVNRYATGDGVLTPGLALHDSQSVWATGVGGSGTAGGIMQLLGYQMPPPPLGPLDPAQALVISLANAAPIEISLRNPWLNSFAGQTAGIVVDTSQQAAGVFVADTTVSSSVILTILRAAGGAQSDVGGGPGDTGTRVIAVVTTGAY